MLIPVEIKSGVFTHFCKCGNYGSYLLGRTGVARRVCGRMRGRQGVADRGAPGLGTVGGDELLLGEAKGLRDGLADVGQGAGGSVFDVALGDGAEELAEGGGQVAGGDEVVGERGGEAATDFFGGEGVGFFSGVVRAKVCVRWRKKHAAKAAVGVGEAADAGVALEGG